MFPLNLYARVRFLLCAIARETAGAARTRSSLRPLFGEGEEILANLGRVASREREHTSNVVTRESGHYAAALRLITGALALVARSSRAMTVVCSARKGT